LLAHWRQVPLGREVRQLGSMRVVVLVVVVVRPVVARFEEEEDREEEEELEEKFCREPELLEKLLPVPPIDPIVPIIPCPLLHCPSYSSSS
jgi:hypothetical protein